MHITGVTLKKIQILESELLKIQNKLEMKIPLSSTYVLRIWTMHVSQITTKHDIHYGEWAVKHVEGPGELEAQKKIDLGEERKERGADTQTHEVLVPRAGARGLARAHAGLECSCRPVWSHGVSRCCPTPGPRSTGDLIPLLFQVLLANSSCTKVGIKLSVMIMHRWGVLWCFLPWNPETRIYNIYLNVFENDNNNDT